MKTEFIYNDEIIATADLERPSNVDSIVKIFGKEYIVVVNTHKVEINDTTSEKMECVVSTLI